MLLYVKKMNKKNILLTITYILLTTVDASDVSQKVSFLKNIVPKIKNGLSCNKMDLVVSAAAAALVAFSIKKTYSFYKENNEIRDNMVSKEYDYLKNIIRSTQETWNNDQYLTLKKNYGEVLVKFEQQNPLEKKDVAGIKKNDAPGEAYHKAMMVLQDKSIKAMEIFPDYEVDTIIALISAFLSSGFLSGKNIKHTIKIDENKKLDFLKKLRENSTWEIKTIQPLTIEIHDKLDDLSKIKLSY